MQAPYRPALPVALNLAGRNVLLIGGGEEAADKAEKLLAADARVTLVSRDALAPLRTLARLGRLCWFARDFVPSDVIGAHWVLLSEVDETLALTLKALKRQAGFWLCTLDQPEHSDIFLVSTLTRGPVQIGISTGGGAPLLARKIRRALETGLDDEFADFARRFADLRHGLRSLPKAERIRRMNDALSAFAMEVRVSYPAEVD